MMQRNNQRHAKFAAIAMVLAGVLFVLYPVLRPFSDETSLEGAAAFGSSAWVAAHVLAIVGFILLPIGLLGVYMPLQTGPVAKTAYRGLIFCIMGVGLTLPFYGAEVFGLHAVGVMALCEQNVDLMKLADDIRMGPGLSFILIGLLLAAVGAVCTAVAIWRSRLFPQWSGIPLAIGLLLYIPQYAANQPIRVAHGALMAVGCIWIAVGVWRQAEVS